MNDPSSMNDPSARSSSRILEAAKEARRVPLLLDQTESRSVDTFLGYQRTQQIDMPQVTQEEGVGARGGCHGMCQGALPKS